MFFFFLSSFFIKDAFVSAQLATDADGQRAACGFCPSNSRRQNQAGVCVCVCVMNNWLCPQNILFFNHSFFFRPKNLSSIQHSILQSIIVRSKERVDATGLPRSKGFGFVEFYEHEVRVGSEKKQKTKQTKKQKNLLHQKISFAFSKHLALSSSRTRWKPCAKQITTTRSSLASAPLWCSHGKTFVSSRNARNVRKQPRFVM